MVITGLGVIAPTGHTVEDLWRNVCSGTLNGQWLDGEAAKGEKTAGCPVQGIPVLSLPFRTGSNLDRCVLMALFAAEQAWREAWKGFQRSNEQLVGVVLGTSRGPLGKWAELFRQTDGGRMPPSLAVNTSISSLSGAVSMGLGLKGPCLTVSAACASSGVAISFAAEQILLGHADMMLAGGTEASLHPAFLATFRSAGILGRHEDPRMSSRPFDRTRNGILPGEGACFLVLESLESAINRGATVLARLVGWSVGTDAHNRAASHGSGKGLRRMIKGALNLSRLDFDELDYIHLHGTGTMLHDHTEATALHGLGKGGRCDIPCSSTKPVTGHCFGASGGLGAIISILALKHQRLPPQACCSNPDPSCGLNLVCEDYDRSGKVCRVMSLSSGFWDHHAALVFEQP